MLQHQYNSEFHDRKSIQNSIWDKFAEYTERRLQIRENRSEFCLQSRGQEVQTTISSLSCGIRLSDPFPVTNPSVAFPNVTKMINFEFLWVFNTFPYKLKKTSFSKGFPNKFQWVFPTDSLTKLNKMSFSKGFPC